MPEADGVVGERSSRRGDRGMEEADAVSTREPPLTRRFVHDGAGGCPATLETESGHVTGSSCNAFGRRDGWSVWS